MDILPGVEIVCCDAGEEGLVSSCERLRRRQEASRFSLLQGPLLALEGGSIGSFDLIMLMSVLDQPQTRRAFRYMERVVDAALRTPGWLISCHDAETTHRFSYTLVDAALVSDGERFWRIEVLRK